MKTWLGTDPPIDGSTAGEPDDDPVDADPAIVAAIESWTKRAQG